MSTIEELEARVAALEAEKPSVRGNAIDLRHEFELFRHEQRRHNTLTELSGSAQASKLSDLRSMVEMLVDGQAEIKAILIKRGEK